MSPLFTVGNVNEPSASAAGEAHANVTIDGVTADSHDVKIVNDDSIPVDVLLRRTWLELPHIGYYKQGNELIIESNDHLYGTVLTEGSRDNDAQVQQIKQTVTQPLPMPDVDAQLSKLANGRILTTLDLSNGFLQIPLTTEAKDKTAFVTEDTTTKFERMPFGNGMKDAPTTFQRLMSIVFKDLREAGKVNIYLDDIIIPSKTWDEMLEDLKLVLSTLSEANLTLKPSKCSFSKRTLDYLGFRITEGEIRPGRKIDTLTNFPRPRDAHEVRRFLGLAEYFRRFIVRYAEIAEPLTQLIAKDAPYSWQNEQQMAFEKLIGLLCTEPTVPMYNPDAIMTEVHTDASSKALSGVLLQGTKTTDLKMIYAVSKRTTPAET
jgi:hypothetical protein